jgi:hypothetical protein
MDPSEYEDTIEKSEDALTAGSLIEEYYEDKKSKYEPLNLSNESDAIHLSIYNLQKLIVKWDEISLNNLSLVWDDQVSKITELKEDYVLNRKELANIIRSYSSKYLTIKLNENDDGKLSTSSSTSSFTDINDNNSILPDIMTESMKKDTKELIDIFKKQFDTLANSNKFSETAFISTYKLLGGVDDPTIILNECLKLCLLLDESLKTSQERMFLAASTIDNLSNFNDSNNANNGGGTIGLGDIVHKSTSNLTKLHDESINKLENRIEELEQTLLTEKQGIRNKIANEVRTMEHELRSVFEEKQLNLQKQFDDSNNRKDNEISALLSSLSDSTQRNLVSDERENTLQIEVQKRRDFEDKLRNNMTELADSRTSLSELQVNYDDSTYKLQLFEVEIERNKKNNIQSCKLLNSKIKSHEHEIESLKVELTKRPSVDLSVFLEKTGIELNDNNNNLLSSTMSTGLTWIQIENILIENIRRTNAEATESRNQEQTSIQNLNKVEKEYNDLKLKLENEQNTVSSLEKDLCNAVTNLESNKSIIKQFQSGKNNIKPIPIIIQETKSGSSSESNSPRKINVGSNAYSPGKNVLGSSLTLHDVDDDIENGKQNKVIANFDGNSGDRMLAAVQSQRDRYMKSSKEKDNELNDLKIKYDRIEEEKITLRSENLELYRRLRIVRANSRSTVNNNNGGYEESNSFVRGTPSKTRKSVNQSSFSGLISNSNEDSLDLKYMNLYEDQIDPFKMEEIDRQNVISRLNIFERGLAYFMKYIMQDQWARQALMVYIFLVHFFAIGYVLQVLNPQLIEEVDLHQRQSWSDATLEAIESHSDLDLGLT